MVELWNSIPWESANWGDVPTWLTGILAAPAVVFAGWQVGVASRQNKITAKQEERAALQEEDSYRPVVIASLEESPASMQFLEFSVRNVGRGPAYDVQVEFTELPQLSSSYEDLKFWEVDYLVNGIPVMGPGQDLRNTADFEISRSDDSKKAGKRLEGAGKVKVSYRSITGREYSEEFRIDFNARRGLNRVNVKTIHHAAKSLETISKALEGLGGAQQKPIPIRIETIPTRSNRHP